MHSALTQLLLESDGFPSVPAHLQRLRERMGEVERELMTLRNCYNSFSPINALPAEVLSNILLLFAMSMMHGYPTWHKKSISWIHATHVCSHWRKVALDSPALWSKILFVAPEASSTMLHRSKSAPLVVESLFRGPNIIDVFSEIFMQSHRLHTLDLSGISSPAFLEGLTNPAPILQKLVLSARPGTVADLPSGFLRGHAPFLRHLEIQRLGFKWRMLPLGSRITYLALAATGPPNSCPSSGDFIDALWRMPLLHTLRLTDMLPRDAKGYTKVTQLGQYTSTPTPALRTLDLTDFVGPITAFLRAVDIPTHTQVKIRVTEVGLPTSELDECVKNLVTSYVQKMKTDVYGLKLVQPSGAMLEVNYFFGQCDAIHETDATELSNISFMRPRSGTGLGECITTLSRHIDISSLKCLIVEGFVLRSAEVWMSAFGHLRSLESITIRNGQVNHFLKALGDGPSQLSFPALATVNLFEVNFLAGHGIGQRSMVSDLVNALVARQAACPLKILRIAECNHFNDAHSTFVRKVLPDLLVEWDGKATGNQMNGMRLFS